jgi:hypothetical protein
VAGNQYVRARGGGFRPDRAQHQRVRPSWANFGNGLAGELAARRFSAKARSASPNSPKVTASRRNCWSAPRRSWRRGNPDGFAIKSGRLCRGSRCSSLLTKSRRYRDCAPALVLIAPSQSTHDAEIIEEMRHF